MSNQRIKISKIENSTTDIDISYSLEYERVTNEDNKQSNDETDVYGI